MAGTDRSHWPTKLKLMHNLLTGDVAFETATTVLVVEDDAGTSRLLSAYLEDFGIKVEVAASGAELRAALAGKDFDLVLLDLGLPDDCGLDLCSWIRTEFPALPLIILTARADPETCVEGLGRGAADYISKPFRPRELLARMRAVLRRHGELAGPAPIKPTGLHHEPRMHRLTTPEGSVIPLSPQENRLVAALMEHRGRLQSRAQLLDSLYPPGASVTDRAIDTLVSNLRRKLGAQCEVIQTVRGEGYVMARDR
jgi:two-component system OmpR family response regulator